MALDLLLVVYPYNGKVLTSFREAVPTYVPPTPYTTTSPQLTELSSWVNTTGFGLVYRCAGCFEWSMPSIDYNETVSTASDAPFMWGYAQSTIRPAKPDCPGEMELDFHNNGYGQWEANVKNATKAEYVKWASLPGKVQSVSCGAARE
jgi:cellobiose dehydrogenase (acceptor)